MYLKLAEGLFDKDIDQMKLLFNELRDNYLLETLSASQLQQLLNQATWSSAQFADWSFLYQLLNLYSNHDIHLDLQTYVMIKSSLGQTP